MTDGDDFGIDPCERLLKEPGMHSRAARRSGPRLPAGTVRRRGVGNGCIPVAAGAFLSADEHGLFQLLVRELLNPLSFGVSDCSLVAEDHRVALHEMVRLAFGCS